MGIDQGSIGRSYCALLQFPQVLLCRSRLPRIPRHYLVGYRVDVQSLVRSDDVYLGRRICRDVEDQGKDFGGAVGDVRL